MPVLEERQLFLVYCLAVDKFIYGKEAGSYEEFFERGCCSSSADCFNCNQYNLQYEWS